VRARKRDVVLRPAEPTPTPPVSATSVAAQRPLLVCKPLLMADSAQSIDPANDAHPCDPRRARSGSKPGDVAVDLLSLARTTPDERAQKGLAPSHARAQPRAPHLDPPAEAAPGGLIMEPLPKPTPEQAEAIAQRIAALILRDLKR
jgi:hypothetical protein